jgi:hypothetical protein
MKLGRILATAAALVLVAGCVDYGVGYYGPGPTSNLAYDVYYDGHYGPFYDGYWSTDGKFYYRRGGSDRWRRGPGKHFRRDAAAGFNHLHGHTRLTTPSGLAGA